MQKSQVAGIDSDVTHLLAVNLEEDQVAHARHLHWLHGPKLVPCVAGEFMPGLTVNIAREAGAVKTIRRRSTKAVGHTQVLLRKLQNPFTLVHGCAAVIGIGQSHGFGGQACHKVRRQQGREADRKAE